MGLANRPGLCSFDKLQLEERGDVLCVSGVDATSNYKCRGLNWALEQKTDEVERGQHRGYSVCLSKGEGTFYV